MKKLPLILATVILPVALQAQTPSTESVATDSVIQIDSVVVAEAPRADLTATESSVAMLGDEEYLIYNGHAYNIENLIESKPYESEAVTKAKIIQRIIMLAICFIIPCVTILAILIILIVFFLKKSKAKNEIIQKAIDSDYQLPDAFYAGQRTIFVDAPMQTDIVQEESGPAKTLFGTKPTDPSSRDPKKFSSGVSLAAVGLALLLFFICQREWGVGLLAGGIPLFLGLGRLIGYFFIPGYTTARLKHDDYYRQHIYDHHAYDRDADYNNPKKTPCPPPCPGTRHDDID